MHIGSQLTIEKHMEFLDVMVYYSTMKVQGEVKHSLQGKSQWGSQESNVNLKKFFI